MIVIQPATIHDVPSLVDISLELACTTYWKSVDLDQSYTGACDTLMNLIDQGETLVALAVDTTCNTYYCGAIIGDIAHHIFLPTHTYFYEHVLYVDPAYRQRRVGPKLWKYAKQWALARGATGGVYGRPKLGKRKNGRQMIEEVYYHTWTH